MDNSLNELCHAIKKLFTQLVPLNTSLSFVVLTGTAKQGKSTLLRQSNLQHITSESDPGFEIYYNQEGLILELNDLWLNQSNYPLQHVLKKINRCHRHYRISGVIYCVDINELFNSEPAHLNQVIEDHSKLLNRLGRELGYPVELSLLLTKLDGLAGFCEFFQNEHASDLKNPLGFSFSPTPDKSKLLNQYRRKFEQITEMLGQQVLTKIHPARSSVKRTLIREFPLQIASLRLNIQALIKAFAFDLFKLRAIYFTSAEQGGYSQDRLIKKIKHEYALTVQEKFHQSVNYRPYFIDGALFAFQKQTQLAPPKHQWMTSKSMGILSAALGATLIWIFYQHIHTAKIIDEASKELLMYENINQQSNHASAEYHLSNAANALSKINANKLSMPSVGQLKETLQHNAQNKLYAHFLPSALNDIESVMTNPNSTPLQRFQALRVYLMLSDTRLFSRANVISWFKNQYQSLSEEEAFKRLALVKEIIHEPMQPISINKQLVTDTRNYLTALPVNYLYYSLAKSYFSKETHPIIFEGFQLTNDSLPAYLTKAGFADTMNQLSTISKKITNDKWVLNQSVPNNLEEMIQQAYCYDYVTWWQNFMSRSEPLHFQNYQQAHQLTQTLLDANTLPLLVKFIQEQTSPAFSEDAELFNQTIASQFTQINLISHSSLNKLSMHITEMDTFLNTLSVIKDNGKTAFNITKARFNGDTLSNPLSMLFNQAGQLPAPLSVWTNQLASEAWYLLISDTRQYINQQWQQTIIPDYSRQIAGRFPFDPSQEQEVSLQSFEHFFAYNGVLNQFISEYIKPFLDTSHAKWVAKEMNHYVLPISDETLNELMRANVITNMFFPFNGDRSVIDFSLQKISLDPVIDQFRLAIGNTNIHDSQITQSFKRFRWPLSDAQLALTSVNGKQYELEETGPWAFFKLLQKVNVVVDDTDSSKLQILFEINGNSGRYLLKTANQVNPFIPGILNDFHLPNQIS